MATTFSEVYDQFLMIVTDYNLITLYNASVTDFETYLSGWLIPAITDFSSCNQSLSYSGTTFSLVLTEENIKILAMLMKKYWLEKQIADIRQMALHVQDKNFKTFAEANNLTAKLKLYTEQKEEVSQALVSYGLADNNKWVNWLAGNFFTA